MEETPVQPPAPPRLGPRPLPLHLAMETLVWWNSLASLPLWKGGSVPWRPELRDQAENLARDAQNVDPEAFARAVDEARPYRQLFPLGAPDRD